MARKVFGPASDFYRARVLALDIPEPPLLEWRTDVLYRTPPGDREAELPTTYAVELVNIDTDRSLMLFSESQEESAEQKLQAVLENIQTLTKAEFDRKYNVIPPVV